VSLDFGSVQDLANPFGSGFAGPENSNLRILSEPEHAQDFSPRVLDISNLEGIQESAKIKRFSMYLGVWCLK